MLLELSLSLFLTWNIDPFFAQNWPAMDFCSRSQAIKIPWMHVTRRWIWLGIRMLAMKGIHWWKELSYNCALLCNISCESFSRFLYLEILLQFPFLFFSFYLRLKHLIENNSIRIQSKFQGSFAVVISLRRTWEIYALFDHIETSLWSLFWHFSLFYSV